MTHYDVAVVGGGTGNNVAAAAADKGQDTVLIEKGPLGGTCLNRGCNPSKILIQRADVINTVKETEKYRIHASINGVDFTGIVEDMASTLSGIAENMEEQYREKEDLTLHKTETNFVDERTLAVDGNEVSADRVVIAAGSRPISPPIEGLGELDYLTSTDALYLKKKPDSLVILGGGYIAVELGYFFEAMNTEVRIVEMEDTLLPREDSDVAERFTDIAEQRHDVYTGYRATRVSREDNGVAVHAEELDGDQTTVEAEELLVAVGRKPNTDTLNLEATNVETDDRGFIRTNQYLETTAENVWAQGDIAGNFMFKHSGDYETKYMIKNAVLDEKQPIDYTATPHAIFTEPQIAGVGRTEDELQQDGEDYVVGTARFSESAMGRAKKLQHGFVKVLASPEGKILGCHIIGYDATTLIHEAVVAMRNDVSVDAAADTIHAHPTLSKVMESAFRDSV